MSLGFTEILLIIIAILLLFGAKRIPELVKSIARASYEYKKAKEMIKKESEEIINADEVKTEVKAEEKSEK
ncbi:MAG: twin-arginine translocase TatA/TatE family subunit [Elusimicrobia bacterium]|nr:twin-arginine translocase TatA/TatE family subunit [Elusimicrobiota bacterium]